MNVPTLIVLLVVAGLLALAIRSMVRARKTGACAGCSEKSCGGAGAASGAPGASGAQGVCPSVARAMADIDAKLDARLGGDGPSGA